MAQRRYSRRPEILDELFSERDRGPYSPIAESQNR
jgi:hypothetical protein